MRTIDDDLFNSRFMWGEEVEKKLNERFGNLKRDNRHLTEAELRAALVDEDEYQFMKVSLRKEAMDTLNYSKTPMADKLIIGKLPWTGTQTTYVGKTFCVPNTFEVIYIERRENHKGAYAQLRGILPKE